MKNKHSNNQNNKCFHQIWERFKDHHKTEGLHLMDVFEIFLPFWQCKQSIIIEKETELDRFSRIILELINNKITNHSEICEFLGIDEDSFVTMQFHFLLKNDLIRETLIGIYEITHEGLSFLQNKTRPKHTEYLEFEYYIIEKLSKVKSDLTHSFFDPNTPIDIELSTDRKNKFSGYTVMQTHQLKNSISENSPYRKIIPHKNQPTLQDIREQRNNFTVFFNKRIKDKDFYDFTDTTLAVHKRNICFYGLLYENKENNDEVILDIRHSKKSVVKFTNSEIEDKLSKEVTKYLKENRDLF